MPTPWHAAKDELEKMKLLGIVQPSNSPEIQMTAITTPFSLFEFLRMPLVYESTFQQMKNRVFSGLPFIFVYLDNILVASPDHTTQKQHRCEVIRHLYENRLTITCSSLFLARRKSGFSLRHQDTP